METRHSKVGRKKVEAGREEMEVLVSEQVAVVPESFREVNRRVQSTCLRDACPRDLGREIALRKVNTGFELFCKAT